VTLVPRRQQLLGRYLSGAPPYGLYGFDRPVDFVPTAIGLRHQPRDGASVARDDHNLPPLDVVEQLRQLRFGFGRLDFS
jgi:hypothetical protein